MADEITLDPGSRIPNPPLSDEEVLDWARELTEMLRHDHTDNVDRVETMVMSDHRTTNRPEPKGSRRFFFDEYTGVLYLDTTLDNVTSWHPINYTPVYVADGQGWYGIYSTSLPVAGVTSGYFVWDEEVWDAAGYWPGSGNIITIPETRRYQVQVTVGIDNLLADDDIIISAIVEGVDLTTATDTHTVWTSDGNAKTLTLNFLRELSAADELQIGYSADSTFDITEMSTIVTPMVEATVGSGDASVGIADHGGLAGLGDDDHALYLLASDATNRATFASYWTDLTDGGETALHTHAASTGTICLDKNSEYQIKNSSDVCQDMISFDGNIMVFGNTTYPMDLYGSSTDIFANTGDVSIYASAAGQDINLVPGTVGTPGDVMITRGDVILDDSFGIRGIVSGGAEKLLIRMNQTGNIVEIGDAAYANVVEFVTTGNIRLARYGSTVQMQENGLAWLDMLSINASDEKIFGATASGVSRLKGANVYLDASAGANINWGGSSSLTFSGGGVIMSSTTRVRLPYLGSAPSSPANGDIWMESDGLHIYYAGAEKTVAGV